MCASSREQRLIILGCGYLGRAVAAKARQSGWKVTALTRNPETADVLRSSLGIEVHVGDLAKSTWHDALDPTNASVLNCVSGGGGGVDGYARSYREGMQSLVAWAQRGVPRTVVYTSSTSVYPDAGGDWVDEDGPNANSPRANILLEAEAVLERAVASGVLPSATVLRLAGIYGPGRHYLVDQVKAGSRVLPGGGDCFLNLIHRDDAADAIVKALEAGAAGFRRFNLSDGHPATKATIVAWTAKQLGLPVPSFDPEKRSERQLRRSSPFDAEPPNRRIANTRICDALSWQPVWTDFRAGYAELLKGG